MSFLAFFGVFLLGSFVLTVVALIAKLAFGLVLFWMPFGVKIRVGSLLAGAVAAAAVGVFSYWLFGITAGTSEKSFLPLIAAAMALLIPYFNDRRKGRQLKAAAAELPVALQAEAAPASIGLPFQAAGYPIGIMLFSVWHLLHSNSMV